MVSRTCGWRGWKHKKKASLELDFSFPLRRLFQTCFSKIQVWDIYKGRGKSKEKCFAVFASWDDENLQKVLFGSSCHCSTRTAYWSWVSKFVRDCGSHWRFEVEHFFLFLFTGLELGIPRHTDKLFDGVLLRSFEVELETAIRRLLRKSLTMIKDGHETKQKSTTYKLMIWLRPC